MWALSGLLALGATPVPAAQNDAAVPEVTVQAQRELIESRVRSYVSDSLYLENDESPARWTSPVCPAVVGMDRDQAQSVLLRLSEIARAAGVPLAGADCTPPNLTVFLTAQPTSFLKKWAKMRHDRIFGDGAPRAINDFIDIPRPVRVWYNTAQVAATGAMQADEHVAAEMFGAGSPEMGTLGNFGAKAPLFVGEGYGDSRVVRTTARRLVSAIVVVDTTKMAGVKVGQMADYIGMNTFARIKLGSHRGDAPTILGLFQGQPAAAPSGMTPWDAAFLEALYHTNPALGLQRGPIVTRMVSHIVPETPR